MTFPFPYGGITVTIERPVYDRFNDVSSWSYFTIEECVDYPASSSESSPNVGIRDARTLLAPPGSDIRPTDRVVLHQPGSITPPAIGTAERRARTYSVNGVPKDWVHAMNGWNPGMSVELEKVT